MTFTYYEDPTGVHVKRIENLLLVALHRPLRDSDLSPLSKAYAAATKDQVDLNYLHVIEPLSDMKYNSHVTKRYLQLLNNYWSRMSQVSIGLFTDNGLMNVVVKSWAAGCALNRPLHVHHSLQEAYLWLNRAYTLGASFQRVDDSLRKSHERFYADLSSCRVDMINQTAHRKRLRQL